MAKHHFIAGFFTCYLICVAAWSVVLTRIGFEPAKTFVVSATWPVLLVRLSQAEIKESK